MATMQRFKTNYPGVFYIVGQATTRKGDEKIFYIRYRRDGKLVEEKAGKPYADDMTAARAASLRTKRMEGDDKTNQEKRQEKVQDASRWTIGKLWDEYQKQLPGGKATKTDLSRWALYLERPFSKKEPKDLVKLDTDRVRRPKCPSPL